MKRKFPAPDPYGHEPSEAWDDKVEDTARSGVGSSGSSRLTSAAPSRFALCTGTVLPRW